MPQPKRKLKRRRTKGRDKLSAEQKPLNPRQELLCNIYTSMEVPNKFLAYGEAGYTGEGMSGKVACHQIFNKPNVSYHIAKLRKERIARLKISGDEVVRKLLVLASSNIKDYMDFDSLTLSLFSSDELSREQAYCIQEVAESVNRDGTRQVKMKLVDKRYCLSLLAQHFGMVGNNANPQGNTSETPEQQAESFKTHLDTLLNSVPTMPSEGGG